VGRRLFLVASWLSNQFERAGKRCAVREDLTGKYQQCALYVRVDTVALHNGSFLQYS
jgi:hypothetical protein